MIRSSLVWEVEDRWCILWRERGFLEWLIMWWWSQQFCGCGGFCGDVRCGCVDITDRVGVVVHRVAEVLV